MAARPCSPKLRLDRCPWETLFQWQCRYRFVHEFREDCDEETAVSLSMLWANKNFLGCSYPKKAEERIRNFPVPRKADLKRWLHDHGYTDHFLTDEAAHTMVKERVTLKRRSSSSGDITPTAAKSGRVSHLTSKPSDSPLATSDSHSSSDEPMPYETLTEQLDFFISSIRRQHEAPSQQKRGSNQDGKRLSYSSAQQGGQPEVDHRSSSSSRECVQVVKMLAQKCACSDCNGGPYPSQILSGLCQSVNLSFAFTGYETEGGASYVAKVFVNEVMMSQRSSHTREAAEDEAAKEVLGMVTDHQRANWKPPCYSSGIWSRVGDTPVRGGQTSRPPPEDKSRKLMGEGRGYPDQQSDRGGSRMMLEETAVGNGIRDRLMEFIHSEKQELVFTADLSPEEQHIVGELSEQYLLKHQNYGSTGSRHIIKKRIDSRPNDWAGGPADHY